MSWESFVATYSHTAGPLRLGHWQCTDPERSSTRLGPQARNFRAMIAVGDCINTSTAAASGPIAALTAMLHERGITVETVKFHQMRSGDSTATFICGTDGIRTEWAMGWAEDSTQSALRALIACANRLGGEEPPPSSRSERAQHNRHAVLRHRHAAVVPFGTCIPGGAARAGTCAAGGAGSS